MPDANGLYGWDEVRSDVRTLTGVGVVGWDAPSRTATSLSDEGALAHIGALVEYEPTHVQRAAGKIRRTPPNPVPRAVPAMSSSDMRRVAELAITAAAGVAVTGILVAGVVASIASALIAVAAVTLF